MDRRRLALLIALVALGGGLVWWRGHARHGAPTTTNDVDAGGPSREGRGGPRDPRSPSWFAQDGAPARRIAGRVTFDGQPIAGATVTVGSELTDAGVVPIETQRSDARGRFDFGPHLAAAYTVVATLPGKAGDVADVDVRDPTARPAPDALELRLGPCDASVYGTIRDASGGVIAGAHVRLATWHGEGPGAITDDSGAYELCFAPGYAAIVVTADGYGKRAVQVGAWARVRKDLELVPEAIVAGRAVRADDGTPVPDAEITIYAPDGATETGATITTTDGEGRFHAGGLLAGRYQVQAEAEGLAMISPVEVVAQAGQTSEDVVCRLAATSRVRGVVRSSPSGKPVAGATVVATSRRASMHYATAVTQADGAFVLASVPREEIVLDVEDHEVVAPKSLKVAAPEEQVTIEVTSLATIAGTVTRAGKPVADAEVYVRPPPHPDGQQGQARAFGRTGTRTLADGTYELTGVEAGAWMLGAQSESAGAFSKEIAIDVKRGDERRGVTIELGLAGSVAGTVIDQAGAPVAGVFVALSLEKGEDYGHATTAADGTFTARALSGGGAYRIEVRRTANAAEPVPPAQGKTFPTVIVKDGDTHVDGVRLAVRLDRLTIAGRVVDSRGGPLADVRVKAVSPDGSMYEEGTSATTDVSGAFSLDDLLAGTYTLYATSGAGARAIVEQVVAPRRDVTITLEDPSTIDGTLTGFPAGAEVYATGRSEHTMGRYVARVDDDRGDRGDAFAIHGLPAGDYLVIAQTRDGSDMDSASVSVAAGQTAHVPLSSRGAATITGVAVDFRGRGTVAGARCSASIRATGTPAGDDSGFVQSPDESVTDDGGRFSLHAPAGALVVSCYKDGPNDAYAMGETRRVVTAGQGADVRVILVSRSGDDVFGTIGAELRPSGEDSLAVASLTPGGAADRAGLRVGDVFVSVGSVSVGEVDRYGLYVALLARPVGVNVDVVVTRDGADVAASLGLDPGPTPGQNPNP